MGYTCGKIMGYVYGVRRGNAVAGELHSFGTHEIYDLNADVSFTIWIEKYWASEDDALDWLERGY